MAKLLGDPNSATNQWFVNLADNLALDDTDGGFTVLAQVLGEGCKSWMQSMRCPRYHWVG
ncbi:MAG: hypothetical protein QGG54_18425 [Gammaproteobacteria bacterium]|mgnify:FL=1|jgi:peptidyl-prolyl cis-trans isomerase A (cyclophilin A)|nr:hypothetical protein [Gammaproteobacteria bacterium]MDP6653687.1 hypothetical protein [Gammaproteobacteria bacterium]|tara:strand:- start:719 stop:898 length:180 start_codon:yes stop_codon:yes gene_type:complete